MWIKICGNTNLADCLLTAELGADALGFVFAAGKRTVTAEQVAEMAPLLPPSIERIGVFTTTDYDEILRTVRTAELTGVQLHGPVDFRLMERLRTHFGDSARHARLLQVVPWWADRDADEEAARVAAQMREIAEDGSADAILIDSRSQQHSGGTGLTFDWQRASAATRGIDYRLVVAGGLTAGNVGAMVASLHPWGADVASGVESHAGKKDPAKLERFLQAARQAASAAAI